jgi:cytochrome c biogenesis factor
VFPVVTEAILGEKITVGPPFFNKVNVPIGLALIVLTGIGPLVAWRRSTPQHLWRSFLYPASGTLATAAILFAAGVDRALPLMGFAFSAFVIFTVALEFWRGTLARRRTVGTGFAASLAGLVAKNKRRYGGYLVHLGMMVLFIGVTGSQAFQTEKTATLHEGEAFDFEGYRLEFTSLTSATTPNMEQVVTTVRVLEDGREVTTLRPERRFFNHPEQATSEVDRYTPLSGDLYLVFVDHDPEGGTAIFKAYYNPLIKFVWTGWMICIFGTLVCVLPGGCARRSPRGGGPRRDRIARPVWRAQGAPRTLALLALSRSAGCRPALGDRERSQGEGRRGEAGLLLRLQHPVGGVLLRDRSGAREIQDLDGEIGGRHRRPGPTVRDPDPDQLPARGFNLLGWLLPSTS